MDSPSIFDIYNHYKPYCPKCKDFSELNVVVVDTSKGKWEERKCMDCGIHWITAPREGKEGE